MIDDEQFFAWLDGELGGEEADRVARIVAASPELTARAEQHRLLADRLRGAFYPVMQDSVPPTFQSAEIIDFGARSATQDQRRKIFGIPQWAAMAASLALGLVVGGQFGGGVDSPIAVQGGQLVAAASLDQALETRLASAADESSSRIGLTFRDTQGRICRSFTTDAASGLACRDGDQWRLRGLFPSGEGQAGDYRMAAGADPRLASLIDEAISGEPFDAAQEKAALERGWR